MHNIDKSTLYQLHEFISKEQLEPIAKDHNIDDLQNLYERINTIADIYFGTRRMAEDMPTKRATKKSIQKVLDQAAKLATTIEELNDFESRWLWMAHRKVRMTDPDIGLKPFEEKTIHILDCPIHLEGLEGGGIQFHYPQIDEIQNTLKTIQSFAQYGLDNLPSGRKGRVKQRGLNILIANLHGYWTKGLKRDFTLDIHDGEGLTEAYSFCLDVAQALSPEVTPTQIKYQMRDIISSK